ncbi:hypothetical protein EIP91_005464 [Steccherinum ochraceum]|uniref:Uncharacterized protein n=1 Tax=Steccherinum ochraceum TaxID=92696 RepID=A0A4R0S2D7_9APHY|nr:hypothetical protein EIP91_005464 [Steccherinum ochraceum]
MSEGPAKLHSWVWHSSAGFIHHPEEKCADCNARQLHISHAAALDSGFKAAVTRKRANKKELEKLKQVLGKKDEEIAHLRAENANLKGRIAQTLEHDVQRQLEAAVRPSALSTPSSPHGGQNRLAHLPPARQTLPSPADSPPTRIPMDIDHDSCSRRSSLAYPPPPPQARAMTDHRVTTRDPRPFASHVTPSLATERGRVVSDPGHYLTSRPLTPPHSTRSPSHPRVSGQQPPYPEFYPGIKRDGSPHMYRTAIGSALTYEEFHRINPNASQLPPQYRRHLIFEVEDVEDLLDRQCDRRNSLSKRACHLLEILYDVSEQKPPHERLPVERYVVEQYPANKKYSRWSKTA